MLLKSFWRKRSMKIYFMIYLLLGLVLSILMFTKNFYTQLDNKNYNGSFLYFMGDKNSLEKLKKIANVKKINRGIKAKINSFEVIFIECDLEIADNSILVPEFFREEIKIGTKLEEMNLIVEGYYNSPNNNYLFLINKNTFETLVKDKQKTGFIIDLKVWTKRNHTVKTIEQKIRTDDFSTFIKKNDTLNYDYIILAFHVFIVILIIAFMFILIVTSINVIEDEKKNDFLYHCLGFSKGKRIVLYCYKLFYLFFFTFVINTIFNFLLLFISK